MNTELISKAVAERLIDVRARVGRLDSQAFGEMGFFVTSVKEALVHRPDWRRGVTRFSPPEVWSSADTDCLTALRLLGVHGPSATRPEFDPPSSNFLEQLQRTAVSRESMFALLARRYAWPLNLSCRAEERVREYLLMQLMTSDRTRIENNSAPVNPDDLLLKLNLISVHAATTNDLRFVDALNYYYELLPETMRCEPQHVWLRVSWYALYARALYSWS